MAKNKGIKKAKISKIIQFLNIQRGFKDLIKKSDYKKNKYFIFRIKPADFCRTFEIRMDIPETGHPNVYVLSPNISNENKNKKIPHVFDKKLGLICLYMPKEVDSSTDYRIIVPWISEWVYFYEIWRITGNWNGGGHEFRKK